MTKVRAKVCLSHDCNNNDRLANCKYCSTSFCSIHLRPKPVGMAPFDLTGLVADKYGKEWRAKDGHPCYEYTSIWYDEHNGKVHKPLWERPSNKSTFDDENEIEIPTEHVFPESLKIPDGEVTPEQLDMPTETNISAGKPKKKKLKQKSIEIIESEEEKLIKFNQLVVNYFYEKVSEGSNLFDKLKELTIATNGKIIKTNIYHFSGTIQDAGLHYFIMNYYFPTARDKNQKLLIIQNLCLSCNGELTLKFYPPKLLDFFPKDDYLECNSCNKIIILKKIIQDNLNGNVPENLSAISYSITEDNFVSFR